MSQNKFKVGDVILINQNTSSWRWMSKSVGPFLVEKIDGTTLWVKTLYGGRPKVALGCVPFVRCNEVTLDNFVMAARKAIRHGQKKKKEQE